MLPMTHRLQTPTGEATCFEWFNDASTVVLLTGMGIPAHSWWTTGPNAMLRKMMAEPYFLAPVLAERFHVVAYDRAGLGESTAPKHPRTMNDFLAELEAVIVGLAGEPPILVGHSIGGLIAFEWARRHIEEVRGLVLLDSSHPHQVRRMERWRPEAERVAFTEMVQEMKDHHPERPDYDRLFTVGESVAGTLDSLPLLVISRGIPLSAEDLQLGGEELPASAAERLANEWGVMQADLASASSMSTHLIAANSRHYPHFDEPRWTAEQIMNFLRLYA